MKNTMATASVNAYSTKISVMMRIANATALAVAQGSFAGAIFPAELQKDIFGNIGYAFGRMIGLPIGVVCKTGVTISNKFLSNKNKIPIKSIGYYSIKIADNCLLVGKFIGVSCLLLTWPILIMIVPYTATAGGVLLGSCDFACELFVAKLDYTFNKK